MTPKPTPTFVIRLTGGEILPEKVPVRTLSDAAAAVSRLAAGECEDSESVSLRIVGVQRSSAAYACLVDDGIDVLDNLTAAGEVLKTPDSPRLTTHMLGPLGRLSSIARKLECKIEIRQPEKRGRVLAQIEADSFAKIRGHALTHDEASVRGYLVQVGGATDRKCRLRVYGRDRLLYCTVKTEELSRQLGRYLYKPVTVHGRGLYFTRTWELLNMKVERASFPTESDIDYDELIEKMRQAGGDSWDHVIDVDAALRAIR